MPEARLFTVLLRVPAGTTAEHIEEVVCVALAEQFSQSDVIEVAEADERCLV